jgi:uncharacterized repeat protein (TIGR03806 family)
MSYQKSRSAVPSWGLSSLLVVATIVLSGCEDGGNNAPFDASDTGDATDILDTSDASETTPLPQEVLPANNQFARVRGEGRVCPEEDYDESPPEGTPAVNLPDEGAFEKLSEYNFFWGEMAELKPNEGVIPYTTASFLWADGTGKARFIVLPEGEKVTFGEEEEWEFPEGTIIVKNFMMPEDARQPNCGYTPLETRLLVRRDNDWISYTYEWNEEGTDATEIVIGKRTTVDLINSSGESETRDYYIPQVNECNRCHARSDGPNDTNQSHLLGVVTPQMNTLVLRGDEYVNQLQWLEDQGIFEEELPSVDSVPSFANPMDESADIDERAISYFYANCSHCHRENGVAGRSQLFLMPDETEDERRGICKKPLATGSGAGGRSHVIVPQHADESILTYRMESTSAQARMPELATSKVDEFGVDLISDWINQLEPRLCTEDFE